MTLIVPMYHRASAGRFGNAEEMLDAHFAHIASRFHCVLPGDALLPGRTNICLTFDDGYFDFYAVVYPLLERHGLRALLAVVPAFIHERVDVPTHARLGAWADGAVAHGGYCTWPELGEMAASGRVRIACHGFTHVRLDRPDADLHTEVLVSRTLLSTRTGSPIDSFVLPYGRFSSPALRQIKRYYRYVFRIGGADNAGWGGRILYRVDADQMHAPCDLFAPSRMIAYRLRRYWNILRRR